MSIKITVQIYVNATIDLVWQTWNNPDDICAWCHAGDDWYTPNAINDLRFGGKFITTMSAKDGSASFDIGGTYTTVERNKKIAYTLDDARTVEIVFEEQGSSVLITETFEMENENTEQLQRAGWQAILNNFKYYLEK